MKKNIVVGLSGGVDSAVTAWLLKNQGYNVTALFMKNWEDDDDDEYCSSKQDLIDAVAVAEKIGIDIEVVNFAKEYKEKVFSIFINDLSGQIFTLFILTVAAAEAAIGLAIIVVYFRNSDTIRVEEIKNLKG